ncbi:MAG: undecaprenyl-phosphate glucose phosphotransferase [Bacteroidia bacterium]
MKVKKQRIIFGYLLLELILLNIATYAVTYFKFLPVPAERFAAFLAGGYLQLSLIYNISWVLIVLLNGNQDLYVYESYSKRVQRVIINVFILLGMSSTIILLSGLEEYPLTILLGPVFVFTPLNLIAFAILFRVLSRSKDTPAFGAKILVLGAGQSGKRVLEFAEQNKHLGYKVVGFLDDHYPGSNGISLLGRLDDLPNVLDKNNVDEIVIALPLENQQEIRTAIDTADYRGVRVNLVPEYPELVGPRYKSYNLGSIPILQLKEIPLDQFHNFLAKKAFDVLFSLAVLIMLSPVLITIAILIKLNSKGPVFYKPVRKGQAGGDFLCYKFRTMYVDQGPQAGAKSTTKDDPRITKIGKVLRRYSLDELPQFINVLKGDMSVVGPRPHRINLNDEFQQMVEKYMVRHYVKPGITGWAQVNGWRGPTQTMEQKMERVRHDLWYIENWSFWLDIRIVWLTVFGSKVHNNAF